MFIASDDASETFAGLKRIHGLMPYFMLKTALKITNPVSMIRSASSSPGLLYLQEHQVVNVLIRCAGPVFGTAIRWPKLAATVKSDIWVNVKVY